MRQLGFLTLSLVFGFMASTAPVRADDGPTAQQIVERSLKQDPFGWDEAETTVRMTLVDGKGKRSERVMESLRRRKNGRTQSVMRFRSPQDVAGTAFLILEREEGETEQHIYLPGLKRTRRIVGREREGSFVGSDFTYADLESKHMRDAATKRLPDDEIGGVKTYVIESTPKKGASSSYSKIETWVRKDDYLPLRIRFYDKKGKLLKTFFTKRIRTIEGRPVVVEMQMVNQQSGHSTELTVEDMKPRKDLPDSKFTPTALEHG